MYGIGWVGGVGVDGGGVNIGKAYLRWLVVNSKYVYRGRGGRGVARCTRLDGWLGDIGEGFKQIQMFGIRPPPQPEKIRGTNLIFMFLT